MKGFAWVLVLCGSSLLQVFSQDVYDATSVPEDFTVAFEDTQTPTRTSKSSPITPPLTTTSKPTTVSTVANISSTVITTPEARNVTIMENEVIRNQTRPKKEVTTLMTDLTDEFRDLPEARYRFDDVPKPVQYYNFPPSEVPKPLTTRNPPAKSPSEQLFLDSQKLDQPIRGVQNFDQPIRREQTQPFPVRQSTPGKAVGIRSTTEKLIVPNYALADQHRLPISALGEHQHHRPSGASEEAQAIVNQEVYSWGKPGSKWEKERNGVRKNNMTRVNHLEAQCQDDFMKIRVNFNGSFSGMIYSAGYAYDPSCVYINGTGRDWYEFYIQLNRCGTLGGNNHNLDSRKQPTKNFMWNTVTVQYNSLIEEEWDEHFKVTCEYGYDFWKTISFPFLDVEVATGNPVVFTLAPPECHMEIRQGYGTTGPRVSGPVRVGDPLTLMVYMRSQYDGFDIVVSDCYAHNGGSRRIQLIDNNGCPVDDKIISRFRGTWSDSGLYETQVFAYMKTFRFTGSPALYIECDVRMCHGQCPNQACHWRGAKEIVKRSVDGISENKTLAASEKLNLYQALQVVGDGEVAEEQKAEVEESSQICLAPGKIGLAIGGMFIVLLLFGVISVISCMRARRLLALLKRSSQEDFYQAYTHSDFNSFSKSQHS